jgi:anti-sigma B factor antagonist
LRSRLVTERVLVLKVAETPGETSTDTNRRTSIHGKLGSVVRSDFRVEVDHDAAVLRLHGELDVASCALLQSELDQLSAAELIIVDLTDLEFIDSSGIGVLVRVNHQMHEDGRRFALVKGSGQVASMLELTGLADRLAVGGTIAELLEG